MVFFNLLRTTHSDFRISTFNFFYDPVKSKFASRLKALAGDVVYSGRKEL